MRPLAQAGSMTLDNKKNNKIVGNIFCSLNSVCQEFSKCFIYIFTKIYICIHVYIHLYMHINMHFICVLFKIQNNP